MRPDFLKNVSYVYVCSLADLTYMAFHIHGLIKDSTKIHDCLVWMHELSNWVNNDVMRLCLGLLYTMVHTNDFFRSSCISVMYSVHVSKHFWEHVTIEFIQEQPTCIQVQLFRGMILRTQHESWCHSCNNPHDDVIKWKHFPRNWPFVRGIHRSRWIPHTKASDAELWCFLWSASE